MLHPAHVLIVEDDADLRAAMVILLQSEGHRVSEAANGQLALDALDSGVVFGVIVLDLSMPVMDGSAFLAQKARGAHGEVPVVIFSSSPSGGLETAADVSSVVPKLDGIDGLLAAIRHAELPGSLPHPAAGECHV